MTLQIAKHSFIRSQRTRNYLRIGREILLSLFIIASAAAGIMTTYIYISSKFSPRFEHWNKPVTDMTKNDLFDKRHIEGITGPQRRNAFKLDNSKEE